MGAKVTLSIPKTVDDLKPFNKTTYRLDVLIYCCIASCKGILIGFHYLLGRNFFLVQCNLCFWKRSAMSGVGRSNVNIKLFLKSQCFASFNFHIFKMLIQELQTYKKLDVFNFHKNILEPHLHNLEAH